MGPAPRCLLITGSRSLPASQRRRRYASSGRRATAAKKPAPSTAKTGDALIFGPAFDQIFKDRLGEADEFYRAVTPPSVSPDAANVMRQALAGMLWSKQYYFLDADQWLAEHKAHPLHGEGRQFRNRDWFHMVNQDMISMPDKWEYPWYAAWDLAFHTLPLSIVDPDFAKQQMELMFREPVPASQRPDPRLRVEFQRRQPAGPCLGHPVTSPHRQRLRGEGDIDFLKRHSTSCC